MKKPKFLYHGSRTQLSKLTPQQAKGDGICDNHFGIYAIENKQIAAFFALSMHGLDLDSRFSIDIKGGQAYLTLFRTEVDWSKKGYLYTLSSDHFEKIDESQWLAQRDVLPEKIEIVDPLQLKDFIKT